MTREKDQRAKDIETLEHLASTIEPDELPVPVELQPEESAALARVLPHLIACGRFVEEHGSTVRYELLAHRSPTCWPARDLRVKNALEALDALRGRRV